MNEIFTHVSKSAGFPAPSNLKSLDYYQGNLIESGKTWHFICCNHTTNFFSMSFVQTPAPAVEKGCRRIRYASDGLSSLGNIFLKLNHLRGVVSKG